MNESGSGEEGPIYVMGLDGSDAGLWNSLILGNEVFECCEK